MTTHDGAVTLRAIIENATGRPVSRTDAGTTLVDRGDGTPALSELLASTIADATSVVGVIPRIETSLLGRLAAEDGRNAWDEAATEVTTEVATEADRTPFETRIVLVGRARDRIKGSAGFAIRPLLDDVPVEVFVAPGDSPIAVLLVDDRAIIGHFDEAGLAALLVSDGDEIREWAAETIRRYLAIAEPLSPTDA